MIRQVFFGTATHVPGVYSLLTRWSSEEGSARYCYAVWLRHLVLAHHYGLMRHPRVVAELGPGTSLGVGFSALISGSESYYACDVVRQADMGRSLQLFDEIVSLFRQRVAIPGQQEFPRLNPPLDDYVFPEFLHRAAHGSDALSEQRLSKLRESLAAGQSEGSVVRYIVPWERGDQVAPGSVDMVCSQAVLEYVDDLVGCYRAMHAWLAPGGIMSHQIDFSAHQTSHWWDGHWTYSDRLWGLMRGRRPFWLNREPCSVHLQILRQLGFEVLCTLRTVRKPEVSREALTERFRDLSSEDLSTRGAFILARKLL
jgi:hypothetical protein